MARNTFPQHLMNLLEKCKISGSLVSGFQKTGIFPFDPDTILTTLPEVPAENLKEGCKNEQPIDIVVPAIAFLFAKSVVKSKRRPKDVRLDTTCGKILNRTEFQEALVKKAADMKVKRALETINRKVVSTFLMLCFRYFYFVII